MKNFLQILLIVLLISSTSFPQDRIFSEEMLGNLKLNAGVFQGNNAEEPRITLNKTELGNSFLLVEEIRQEWDTTHWANSGKSIYTHDLINNNLIKKLDKSWDGANWENSGKNTYTYDINTNNLIEELLQIWDTNHWEDYWKWTYTYDVNNKLFRVLMLRWYDSSWGNLARWTYTWDDSSNLIERLQENWVNSNWVNETLETWFYDVNNNRIELLRKVWLASNWENDARWLYYYDGNNNLIEELQLNWINSNWENHWRYFYTYDMNSNLIEILIKYWSNSNWEDAGKATYTYDSNNNQVELFYKSWNGYAWENSSRVTYYYLPAGSEQIEHKRENLNKAIEDFQTTEDDLIISSLSKTHTLSLIGVKVLIDSVLHTSDSDLEFTLTHNGVSETIIYQAGGDGDNFIGTKLTDDGIDSISGGTAPFSGNYKPENPLSPFVGTDPTGSWTLSIYDGIAGNTGTLQAWGLVLIYNSSVGIENEITFNPVLFQLYQNYPNPFNPSTKIKFSIPSVGTSFMKFVQLKVYDVLGNEVETIVNEELSAGEYEVNYMGEGLTSGVYFYQLRAGEFIQTKKMLLIK